MDEKPAKEKEPSGEWSMPEPVFRSSEGVSLKEMASAAKTESGLEDEMPTEIMGFVSDEDSTADDETPEPNGSELDEPHKQSVRVKEKPSRRHTKKKRTKSKLMRGLALFVGLLIGSVILAVIYFVFR